MLPTRRTPADLISAFRSSSPHTSSSVLATAPTPTATRTPMLSTTYESELADEGQMSASSARAGQEDSRPALRRATQPAVITNVERSDLREIERALSLYNWTKKPKRSILNYLRHPGDNVAPYEAALTVLRSYNTETEEPALQALLVYRFIHGHALWKHHPDPTIQSADDFVRLLDNGVTTLHNINMGARGRAFNLLNVRRIDEAWGRGWFERVPEELRDPEWVYPEDFSKHLMRKIAITAQQGVTFDDAVAVWKERYAQRTDTSQRARRKTNLPTTEYLIPSDVEDTHKAIGGSANKRLLDEPDSDQAHSDDESDLEVVAPAVRNGTSARKRQKQAVTTEQPPPEYLESGPSRSRRKRLRGDFQPQRLQPSSPQPWQAGLPDQFTMGPPSPRPTTPDEPIARARPHHPAITEAALAAPAGCQGRSLADGMRDVLDIFADICDPDDVRSKCCAECQAHVRWIAQGLERLITPSVNALHSLSRHPIDDADHL